MAPSDLDELLGNCPYLFHMAERGAWNGIQKHGLLSTSSLLDLYEVDGDERLAIESKRRDETIEIKDRVKIRDQRVMDDDKLKLCLPRDISTRQWYEFLNRKVFFWLTKKRLDTFSTASTYHNTEHEVLVLNSRKLVKAYRDRIWLCPINSGSTLFCPVERSYSTFSRINYYPYYFWWNKRDKKDPVVELCVDYRISDIVRFVERVYVVRGTTELCDLT